MQASSRTKPNLGRHLTACVLLAATTWLGVFVAAKGSDGSWSNAQSEFKTKRAFRDTPHRVPPLAKRYFRANSAQAVAISAILKRPPHPLLDGRVGIHV